MPHFDRCFGRATFTYNVHDDGFSEGTLTESGARDYGVKGRHLAAECMIEYGSRVVFTDYGWGAGDWTAAASSLATAPNLYSWMHKRADLGPPVAIQVAHHVISRPGTPGSTHDAEASTDDR